MDGISNNFPAKIHQIAGFSTQNFKNFPGCYSRTPAEAFQVLGPRHQFPLGSPAFPLLLFCETATVVHDENKPELNGCVT